MLGGKVHYTSNHRATELKPGILDLKYHRYFTQARLQSVDC